MTRLVLIAGAPSHGPGAHEHRAGSLLLQRCLQAVPDLEVEVHSGGWVADDEVLERADAIAIYADGGAGHPILVDDRLETLDRLMDRGVGLALMHWAVEVPVDRGAPQLDRWIGAHYEDLVSCNPMWDARFEHLPEHPITRGVSPFATHDEWYFNLRSGDEALANEPVAGPGRPWPDPGRDAVRHRARGPVRVAAWPVPCGRGRERSTGDAAVGDRASRRWSRLRPVGRPLPRQLGDRRVPDDGAQRARLAGGRGGPGRWGRLPCLCRRPCP